MTHSHSIPRNIEVLSLVSRSSSSLQSLSLCGSTSFNDLERPLLRDQNFFGLSVITAPESFFLQSGLCLQSHPSVVDLSVYDIFKREILIDLIIRSFTNLRRLELAYCSGMDVVRLIQSLPYLSQIVLVSGLVRCIDGSQLMKVLEQRASSQPVKLILEKGMENIVFDHSIIPGSENMGLDERHQALWEYFRSATRGRVELSESWELKLLSNERGPEYANMVVSI